MSEDKKETLEKELWLHKAKESVALDTIAFNRPSKQSLELIYSMPHAMQLEMAEILKDPKQVLEWFNNYTFDKSSADLGEVKLNCSHRNV